MIESLLWVTLCVYFESRGEPVDGQIAVAHVILNRAEKRGLPVAEIIKQPYQFSWYEGKIPPVKDFNAFVKCAESVHIALTQRLHGITLSGCDHFYSTDIVPPYWVDAMKREVEVDGKHRFFMS